MPPPSTLIKTPLGALEFMLGTGSAPPAEASLKTVSLRPKIPPGMSVLACYGVILQIKTSAAVDGLSFKASLRPTPLVRGGPATGEGLEALEWTNNDYVMLVGTEDTDYLQARLNTTIALPDNPFTYSNDSLSILIGEIQPNRSLSLHFIVAWNKLPESVESSCWFAVDQPHVTVLGAA